MRRSVSALLVLGLGVAAVGMGACGADDSMAAADTSVNTPDTVLFDTSVSSDATQSSDATTPDDTSTSPDGAEDSVSQDTRPGETVAPLGSLKADDTYLVPGNIAKKAEVAAFGHTVAWVETPADGAPFFVVWDISVQDVAPRTLAVPNLVRPRQLVLSRELLVYVDDRYGTPDVFALGLERGDAFTVVTAPGAQDRPALVGGLASGDGSPRVAWEDCRACVTGDDGSGWEIYARSIDVARPDLSPAEVRITNDSVADRRPAFGTGGGTDEADASVLAWVRGRSELRVVDPLDPGGASAQTIDVASEMRASEAVSAVAVTPGVLAWRTRPVIVNPDSMIVNPDSMYPTDVRATDIAGGVVGVTTKLTTHGELREGYDVALRTAASKLAWLQSTPAFDRIVILNGLVPEDDIIESGVHAFALGGGVLAFVAPRADNDGLDDVWVLPLD